jgi:hypothetical protein
MAFAADVAEEGVLVVSGDKVDDAVIITYYLSNHIKN